MAIKKPAAAPTQDEPQKNPYDDEATKMVQQAVMDYINTLPPSARAATELYYRGVLPRVKVLA